MFVTDTIKFVGVDDHKIEADLFEGQYPVPNGMSYNSYVIMDDKIAVMDTVDGNFAQEWLDKIAAVLGDRKPDYLVIQHMEPDHSGSINAFMAVYPETAVVSSEQAFGMMKNFYGSDYPENHIVVAEGSTLALGTHNLFFVGAPLVHWPEVLMTYETTEKVLFAADGFGKFGANDVEEDWADEARRYYIGIVGKLGAHVQAVLAKAGTIEIKIICPLHGPVLSENLGYYLNLYNIWSSYAVESEGIVVAYTSVYGNTKKAAELLATSLRAKGCPNVVVYDLARCDMSAAVADAFRYSGLVLATTTYNANIYPFMSDFINRLTDHNYQNRTVAFIENGSWAPMANKIMRDMFCGSQNLKFATNNVTINSALNEESAAQLEALAKELCGCNCCPCK